VVGRDDERLLEVGPRQSQLAALRVRATPHAEELHAGDDHAGVFRVELDAARGSVEDGQCSVGCAVSVRKYSTRERGLANGYGVSQHPASRQKSGNWRMRSSVSSGRVQIRPR
jgi:hypothetical protein